MEDKALKLYNQDLAGFFISIDTARFLESWDILLRFLALHMSVDENEYFSVSPVKQNNPGDIIKGRTFRTLNVNRHIRISHGTSNAEFSTWVSSVYPSPRLSNGFSSFTCFVPDGGISVRTNLAPHPCRVDYEYAPSCTFSLLRGQQVGFDSIIHCRPPSLSDFD